MFSIPCKIAPLNEGLDTTLFRTSAFAEFVRAHFRSASSGDIDLQVQFDPSFRPLLSAGEPAVDGDLHFAMRSLTHNPSSPPIAAMGLLVGSAHRADTQMFGLMFDQGIAQSPGDLDAAVAREGAAIFVDSIARARSPAEFEAECRFTSVHELGHAFNLAHAPQEPPTFMSRSALNGTAYANDAYFFLPEQENRLGTCSIDPHVQPGGSPFTNEDSSNRGRTRETVGAPRLKMTVDVRPKECTRFEPVHLDITLSVVGSDRSSMSVPRMVDPAHGVFRIYITDPSGNERQYLNSTHCCSASRKLIVSRAEPFRRDIVLLTEQGRYTFRSPGVHRVRVEFDIARRKTLHSNSTQLTILKEERGRWERSVSLLRAPNATRLLQYRRTPSYRALQQMSEMIRSWRGRWDERKCLIAYRWALAVLESRARERSPKRADMAIKYLEKCRYLRPHREARAAALVVCARASNW